MPLNNSRILRIVAWEAISCDQRDSRAICEWWLEILLWRNSVHCQVWWFVQWGFHWGRRATRLLSQCRPPHYSPSSRRFKVEAASPSIQFFLTFISSISWGLLMHLLSEVKIPSDFKNEWDSCSSIHRRSDPLWIYFDFVFPFDLLKPMSLHVILVFLKHKNANKTQIKKVFTDSFAKSGFGASFFPQKKWT